MPNTTVPAAATGLPFARRIRRANRSKSEAVEFSPDLEKTPQEGLHSTQTLASLVERECLRLRIERAIDKLIAALDAIDGDADLEPVLGAPEINAHCRATCRGPDGRWMSARSTQKRWAKGTTDDREEADEDGSDLDEGEHDSSDLEPSLGAPEAVDQTRWAQGNHRDLEGVAHD